MVGCEVAYSILRTSLVQSRRPKRIIDGRLLCTKRFLSTE